MKTPLLLNLTPEPRSSRLCAVKSVCAIPVVRASAYSRLPARQAGWLWAVLLRLSALMLVLQLSGAGPLVSAMAGREDAGCSERCTGDDESPWAQCPPSCPSCTCVHAAWFGLPVSSRPAVRMRLAPVALLVVPISSAAYTNPSSSGIFRPPRG